MAKVFLQNPPNVVTLKVHQIRVLYCIVSQYENVCMLSAPALIHCRSDMGHCVTTEIEIVLSLCRSAVSHYIQVENDSHCEWVLR